MFTVSRSPRHLLLLGAAVGLLALPSLRADQVARWTFDGHLRDSVGNHDGPLVSLNNPSFTQGVDGGAGGAAHFDGSSQVVRFASGEYLPIFRHNGGYSISLWVRGEPQLKGGDAGAVVFAETSSVHPQALFSIGCDSSGRSARVEVSLRDEQGNALLDRSLSTNGAFDGDWHHLAWVQRGGIGRLYIDGVVDQTTFVLSAVVADPSFSFDTTTIGAELHGASVRRVFRGEVDDASVFTHLLSQQEIHGLLSQFYPLPPGSIRIGGFVLELV